MEENLYIQKIGETIFKYRKIDFAFEWNNKDYFIMENIETGFRLPLCETEITKEK
jgi:hypothetical protein